MLCFLFDVFSLEVKSRPKMKWITKEELERDLNELLPDKDVCDIIMLYIRMKNLYRACFPSFSRKRVRLLVRSFRAFVCLLVHSFSFFFCACFFFLLVCEVRSPIRSLGPIVTLAFATFYLYEQECLPRTFQSSFRHAYSLNISMQFNGHALVCKVDTCMSAQLTVIHEER